MWIPSRFALIEKPFSEADGLVNSTMKLVRYKTAEFYKDRIVTLYESEEANRKANLEVVKNLFFK
jgi:long-chain acyl-CoA synthetase